MIRIAYNYGNRTGIENCATEEDAERFERWIADNFPYNGCTERIA